MEPELTIVCFLWNGDRWSPEKEKGVQYVNALASMVSRNLALPHRRVCFSDRDYPGIEGWEVRPLRFESHRGCLPKLYMFSEEAGLFDKVLALDIDIIITGSLDDIASYNGDFCVRSKFAPGQEWKGDGDIIGFNPDKCRDIWRKYIRNVQGAETMTGGRERYWYRKVRPDADRFQDLYPNQVFSYKRHVRDRALPKNARIVSCHGRPRPHEIKEKWAMENWC